MKKQQKSNNICLNLLVRVLVFVDPPPTLLLEALFRSDEPPPPNDQDSTNVEIKDYQIEVGILSLHTMITTKI